MNVKKFVGEAFANVDKTLKTYGKELQWKPYGGTTNNWSSINNQAGDVINCLVEKLTNSMDAVMFAQLRLQGISPKEFQGNSKDALKKCYGISSFSELSSKDKRTLSENIQLIAEGNKEILHLTVFDKGEGQTSETIEDTLLALPFNNKSNKKSISCALGAYGMGGSGMLMYCDYQLILTKPPKKLLSADKANEWTFTIIRLKEALSLNDKYSYFEYCVGEDGKPLTFDAESLDIFATKYYAMEVKETSVTHGTIVKMLNIDSKSAIKTSANILFALWADINRVFPNPILPVMMFELREAIISQQDMKKAKKDHNASKGMWGNAHRLFENDSIEKELNFNLYSSFMGSTPIPVKVWVLNESVTVDSNLTKYSTVGEAIFFTVEGKVHYAVGQSGFNSSKCNLGELAKYLLIYMDFTHIPARYRETAFKPSRDRMKKEAGEDILKALYGELAENRILRNLNEKLRMQKIAKHIKEGKTVKDRISDMIRKYPQLGKWFPTGKNIPTSKPTKNPSTSIMSNFVGVDYPTILKLGGDSNVIELQIKSTVRVTLLTDVKNGYLDSVDNYFFQPAHSDVEVRSISLHNGEINIRFKAQKGARIGEKVRISFGLVVPNGTPLKVSFSLLYVPEVQEDTKPGTAKRKSNKVALEGLNISNPILIHDKNDPLYIEYGFSDNKEVHAIFSGQAGASPDIYINCTSSVLDSELKSKRYSTIGETAVNDLYVVGTYLTTLKLIGDEIISKNGTAKITVDDVPGIIHSNMSVLFPLLCKDIS